MAGEASVYTGCCANWPGPSLWLLDTCPLGATACNSLDVPDPGGCIDFPVVAVVAGAIGCFPVSSRKMASLGARN
jgi:hypothetical protein